MNKKKTLANRNASRDLNGGIEEWKSMLTFDNVLILCFAGEGDPRTQKSEDCNCQAPKPKINYNVNAPSYF